MTTNDFDYKRFMPEPEPTSDRLLVTVEEAARGLSFSRTIIYERAQHGELQRQLR
jgi:hypothetical protein